MLRTAANALKRRAPRMHKVLKRFILGSKFPAFTLLNGKFTLTALKLISAPPTEPHVLRWIDELLHPGDTFFDVGAHYGWMSMEACHRVGGKGKVVAFEPSPPLVELLQYNKKANRFRQMKIVCNAVADSDGRVVPFYLVDRGDSFLNSLVDHRTQPTAKLAERTSAIQVETITLDEFAKITKMHPNAVKIDVEGAELLVLQGSRELLKERRAAFIVSVHPTWLPPGQSIMEVFDLFRVHGYRVATSQVVEYDGADFGDYLFVPG